MLVDTIMIMLYIFIIVTDLTFAILAAVVLWTLYLPVNLIGISESSRITCV